MKKIIITLIALTGIGFTEPALEDALIDTEAVYTAIVNMGNNKTLDQAIWEGINRLLSNTAEEKGLIKIIEPSGGCIYANVDLASFTLLQTGAILYKDYIRNYITFQ